MRLRGLVCWLRDRHQFAVPEDPSAEVDVEHLTCDTCGKDFLDQVAYLNDVSREEAGKYFVADYLLQKDEPEITVAPTATPLTKKMVDDHAKKIRNPWWR
jgi:hypothetical protein